VTYNNRVAVLLKLGEYSRALADLEQARRLLPNLPNVYKNLAWLQATCPDPAFRDGSAAVANATRALQLANARPVEWLAILAAGHAEAGNFEEAVRLQTHCLAEARPEDLGAMKDRLELYRNGQPYRDGWPGLNRESRAGKTGPTPRGTVDRVLTPGCVFDNTPVRSHSEPLG
jgi:tetratricopeptide (TPR) repeat protein